MQHEPRVLGTQPGRRAASAGRTPYRSRSPCSSARADLRRAVGPTRWPVARLGKVSARLLKPTFVSNTRCAHRRQALRPGASRQNAFRGRRAPCRVGPRVQRDRLQGERCGAPAGLCDRRTPCRPRRLGGGTGRPPARHACRGQPGSNTNRRSPPARRAAPQCAHLAGRDFDLMRGADGDPRRDSARNAGLEFCGCACCSRLWSMPTSSTPKPS